MSKRATVIGISTILVAAASAGLLLNTATTPAVHNQTAAETPARLAEPVTPPQVTVTTDPIDAPVVAPVSEPATAPTTPFTDTQTPPAQTQAPADTPPPVTEVSERVDYAVDPNDATREIGTCVVTWSDGSTTSRVVGARPVSNPHGVKVSLEC